ncbi:MAG: isocitrate/isopropylmalate dehydrogenase family protein [Anaerolineae bacterium]|nr:isocitrate/isopropylmalate dehydrogenase family protein [Anaerolineae bacterium]
MTYSVCLIPGDGVGQEVIPAAAEVLGATGLPIEFVWADAGWACFERTGDALPPATVEAIQACGVALFGATQSPMSKVAGYRSPILALRKTFDLYANIRPTRSLPAPDTRQGLDFVIVRENTEDLYAGLEHVVVPGVVESLKIITEKASTRIGHYAFELARREHRHRVTSVHKANIMKLSDGLFLECTRKVAKEYPDIAYDEVIVDAMSMHLVMRPETFDVLVMENLYGDIISDLASGLVGGLGLTPSGNIGEKAAVFEAVHGSAPDIAGKGIANPTAVMLSGVMMLRHLGKLDIAARLEKAIFDVIAEHQHVTRDLGGTASIDEYTDAVIAKLDESVPHHEIVPPRPKAAARHKAKLATKPEA